MAKKIINVKYHPNVIGTMNSEELESITCDIKKLIGDDYVVIFSPFDFQEIPEMEIEKARETLMLIHGVGPKVAECALLYGFHRLEAFPMDVWMKRVMAQWFPDKTPENFGPYAGIAQQYLFHYIQTFEKEN